MPENTATPIAWRISAPAPVEITIGKTPIMNAIDVIKIGRKRKRLASLIAANALMPLSCNSFANSTIRMAFLVAKPTAFFLTEITIRFLAEKRKMQFFKSFWNWFDTLIVIISLIPADDAELALIARLVRVFRVLRMISIIPELRILLVSLVKALPQLGYVMLLMFIIFYIYAAIGSTLFENINPVLWGDITISMLTLFRVMTFEDWTDVMYATMEQYPLSWVFYITFIFLTAFVFLNMMIGAILEVMSEEQNAKQAQKAHDERDEIARQLQAVQVQLAELTKQISEKR